MFIFDAHSDIWMKCAAEWRIGNGGYFKDKHYALLKAGEIGGSIFVIFTQPDDNLSPENYFWREMSGACMEMDYIEKYMTDVKIINRYADIDKAIEQNKFFIILGAEGLSAIGADINKLSILYRLGLRHASLTWNEENTLATGVGSENAGRGVTDIGEQAVKRMEELGMVLDVSHLNEKSFWDITEIAVKPFIASHSNSKTLCNHRRNLSDEQAKAIAKVNGVIGVNVCGAFVSDSKPTINKYIDHIDYFVKLIGIDHVGIGFDFCDFLRDDMIDENDEYFKKLTVDLEHVNKSKDVLQMLKKRGYSEKDIEKIAYKNFLRVLEDTIK